MSSASAAPLPQHVAALAAALADRYAIERELGRGGMATVYLARDVKHQRQVALKVLDLELGAVLGGDRFLGEIRVTANLHHPNLLPLFDSGAAAGLLYYVMPFVEGESLRARLDRERQLPVDEAVRIAIAVANALDYAHAHGVIHRDLKPENILLQHGQPVVADFGIALAVSNAGGQRVTQTGISLGTPQYMSPEQATGDRVIDGRTDVYSLGAVCYEMLAGEPPHTGATAQAVIARLMTEEPRPVTVLRRSVPAPVDAAVRRALEKLPADRFATAKEFAAALTDADHAVAPARAGAEGIARGTLGPRSRAGDRARRIALAVPWLAAAVSLAALALRTRPDGEHAPLVLPLAYPDSLSPPRSVAGAIALSGDGRTIVFSAEAPSGGRPGGLYVRRLDQLGVRRIPGTEGARWPVIDDRTLYFVRDGKLYRTPLEGGAPTLELDSVLFASRGDRGSMLIDRGGRVARIAPGAREPVAVPIDDRMGPRVYASRFPEFLPGERYFLASVRPEGARSREIAVVDAKTGAMERLRIEGAHARYSATGHITYVTADGALMAAPFSLRSRKPTAPARRVADGVALAQNGAGAYAISQTGVLVALHGTPAEVRHLEMLGPEGAATRLTRESRQYGWTVLSPDGRRLAVEIADAATGLWDVWVLDLESQALARVTSGGGGIRPGGWMPAGDSVVFLQGSITGPLRAVAQARDGGSAAARVVLEDARPVQQVSVAPGARWVAAAVGRLGATDIVVAPLDSPRATRPLVATPANETDPRVSPDGALLAYVSDESGRAEVYVRPIVGRGARTLISAAGGIEPVWDRRGGALFYRDPTGIVRAQLVTQPELRVAGRDSLPGTAATVGWIGGPSFDVFPDGRRVVAMSGEARPLTAAVYLDWPGRRGGDR